MIKKFLLLAAYGCCFLSLSCGCASKHSSASRSEGLLKARAYVQRYGQITNTAPNDYLRYLCERISKALSKGSYREQDFNVILLNTAQPIAASVGGGIVLLSRGIVRSLNTEAELAFILAHEMAHQHLGHKIPDSPETAASIDENKELEADRLAFATIAAAGYDPRYATAALKHTYQYSMNMLLDYADYPSLQARAEQISQLVKTSGWNPPGSISRAEFKKFKRTIY